MKVKEILPLIEAENMTPSADAEKEILCGYTCDLLSHVMGKGQADMAWITVQAHMNVIAVAALLDFACVIIPENLPVEEMILKKAQAEDARSIFMYMLPYAIVYQTQYCHSA